MMAQTSYAGYRFPPEEAVWLYLKFNFRLRNVGNLLAEREITSCEMVRRWVNHFGPEIAADLRRRRSKPHTIWYLDDV